MTAGISILIILLVATNVAGFCVHHPTATASIEGHLQSSGSIMFCYSRQKYQSYHQQIHQLSNHQPIVGYNRARALQMMSSGANYKQIKQVSELFGIS